MIVTIYSVTDLLTQYCEMVDGTGVTSIQARHFLSQQSAQTDKGPRRYVCWGFSMFNEPVLKAEDDSLTNIKEIYTQLSKDGPCLVWDTQEASIAAGNEGAAAVLCCGQASLSCCAGVSFETTTGSRCAGFSFERLLGKTKEKFVKMFGKAEPDTHLSAKLIDVCRTMYDSSAREQAARDSITTLLANMDPKVMLHALTSC